MNNTVLIKFSADQHRINVTSRRRRNEETKKKRRKKSGRGGMLVGGKRDLFHSISKIVGPELTLIAHDPIARECCPFRTSGFHRINDGLVRYGLAPTCRPLTSTSFYFASVLLTQEFKYITPV